MSADPVRPGWRRMPGRGLVVSFAGLPGAGKSTLAAGVVADIARRDLDIAVLSQVERIDGDATYGVRRPDYWRLSTRLIRASTSDPTERDRRERWWFARSHHTETARMESAATGRPVLVEEAMLHDVWRISHWLGHGERARIRRLMRMVPRPDLLFHVSASPDTALERINEKTRGGPVNEELGGLPPDHPLWRDGAVAYDELVGTAAETRTEVIEIDNDRSADLSRNVDHVLTALTARVDLRGRRRGRLRRRRPRL